MQIRTTVWCSFDLGFAATYLIAMANLITYCRRPDFAPVQMTWLRRAGICTSEKKFGTRVERRMTRSTYVHKSNSPTY